MTMCAMVCVRGPRWRTGIVFVKGSIASHSSSIFATESDEGYRRIPPVGLVFGQHSISCLTRRYGYAACLTSWRDAPRDRPRAPLAAAHPGPPCACAQDRQDCRARGMMDAD